MEKLDTPTNTRAANVARSSYGRLLALLASRSRDISIAEDALSDAFERALRTWPVEGIPNNPEAWLLTAARNRQTDQFRSAAHRTSISLDGILDTADPRDDVNHDEIPDKRLALMFVCAHPAIELNIRTPLMLQVVFGFNAEEMARAFAIPAPTMAQRLVRAKRRIRDAGIPFSVPEKSEMKNRLPDVLEAIYGAYAIDWRGVAGSYARDSLSWEALYLAETLADLLKTEPETLGLVALICFSLARTPGRIDANGNLVPLPLQETSLWDASLIDRGEKYLLQAHSFGRIGRFQLEAAIQAVHCNRHTTGSTDWLMLHKLYDALIEFAPTLGALVARSTVISEIEGPIAGIAALDKIQGDSIRIFQPAWAARAHFLSHADQKSEALQAFEKALSLTTDPIERKHLAERIRELSEVEESSKPIQESDAGFVPITTVES